MKLIECLRQLSTKHRMSIIASIHQPNNDLLHKFDSIYVLAKGGVCLYSGKPQNLRQHLNECYIECNENQVSIEVLMKLSFEGINSKNVKQLCEKTCTELTDEMNSDLRQVNHKIKTNVKAFKIIDFWYLLMRFLYRDYVMNWKNNLIQLLLYISIIMFLIKCLNENIHKIDGCFQLNSTSNKTCFEREDEKWILSQNQSFLHFSSYLTILFQISFLTYNYANDLKFYSSEHQNR